MNRRLAVESSIKHAGEDSAHYLPLNHDGGEYKIPTYKRVAAHAHKTLKYALKWRRQGLSQPWRQVQASPMLGSGPGDGAPGQPARSSVLSSWMPWPVADSSHDKSTWHQIPEHGLTCDEVLAIFEQEIQASLVPVANPNFMGHMITSLPAAVHEADILMSYLNQNLVKMETSGGATIMERVVLGQFHQLVYQRSADYYKELVALTSRNVGLMVQGGTMGNLVALTVARNHVLDGVDQLGMSEALRRSNFSRAVIISSERCHYSLLKISSILGLGKAQLIKIPVDPLTQKMRLDVLDKTINYLQAEGTLVVACVAVASSTETGSVDDLTRVAEVCERYRVWFHVDAAWGGAYLWSETLAPLLRGIDRADSVVVDGHKLLGLTMGGGMVLFKDAKACQVIHQSAHYVARDDSCDSGRFHLEGSRPFYALKIWMLMQRKGRLELARLIEGSHERARVFEKSLARYGCFVQTTRLETNILTYCWCPPQMQAVLRHDPDHIGARWLCECLDQVQDRLHELGWSRQLVGFVSKTRLEIRLFGRSQHRTVLRAVPAQATTTAWHIKDLLEDQMRWAEAYFASILSSQMHKVTSWCDTLPAHSILSELWQELILAYTDHPAILAGHSRAETGRPSQVSSLS